MQPRFHIWDCMGPQSLTFCWSVWCNYPNNQYNYYALHWDEISRVGWRSKHWQCHHKDYLSLTRNVYLWVTRNWNDVFVCLGGLQVTETDVECHWLCPHPTSSLLPCSALLTPSSSLLNICKLWTGDTIRCVPRILEIHPKCMFCFECFSFCFWNPWLRWGLLVGNFEERCILLMPSSVPPVSRLGDAGAWDIDLFALGEHELSQRSQEIVRKCVK